MPARESRTQMIATDSSIANEACLNMFVGMTASSSGTMPPVSTSRKVLAFHSTLAKHPVTRDARLVADDRLSTAREAVKERRFADVRPADDCDERLFHTWKADSSKRDV